MTYNMTAIETSYNIVDMLKNVNIAANGLFINSIMLILYLILLIGYKKYTFRPTLIVASLIMVILAISLFALQVASQSVLILPIVLFIVSLIIYKFTE